MARRVPVGFQHKPCILSFCALSSIVAVSLPFSMSQSRTMWSPDAEVRMLEAVGWKTTWPTFLRSPSVPDPRFNPNDLPSRNVQLGVRFEIFRLPAFVAPAVKQSILDLPQED